MTHPMPAHPLAPVNLLGTFSNRRPKSAIFIATFSLFASGIGEFHSNSWAQTTAAPAATRAVATDPGAASWKAGDAVVLNFANADIEAVARAMATLTGRNVVVDPRVKGQISLQSERAVRPTAALDQFAAALRLQGYAMVEAAGLYKVVPEADAKLLAGGVLVAEDGKTPGANTLVTQIFSLRHENANNLLPVLRPLIGPNQTININPGTNALVITDYAENLQRIGRIVAALDVANATDLEVIPLQHAVASEMAVLVQRLSEGGGSSAPATTGQTDTAFKTTILAEPRSNALLVRTANPARLALVRSLVDKLDRPTSAKASGNIHVVHLKNADAVQLANTLRAAMAAENGQPAGTGNTGAVASTAATRSGLGTATTAVGSLASGNTSQTSAVANTTGGTIQADVATNSLIITAPEPTYRQIRAIIDQLDTRRAQVYVESLIAEVNADRAAEFGIQWQGALGKGGDSVIGLLGSNFGTTGKNILNLAAGGGTVTPGRGLNFGLAQQTNGVYVLGFLARALEENGDGNVLSTPNLLTLDNEEAKIVIGQNVPFVTGQYTNNNTGTTGTVNPFQTIERKDVGLTLKVKPQISENGTVKMAIYQEASSVVASSVGSSSGLITNKRSIESQVLVNDGQIVVLGGLLQDEYSGNVEQIPGLGSVPIIGNLFKSQSRGRKKTNLMVFLRPVVVRDANQTNALAQDRYEQMRAIQQQAQPDPSRVLGINEAPVLPARMGDGFKGTAAATTPLTTTPAQ